MSAQSPEMSNPPPQYPMHDPNSLPQATYPQTQPMPQTYTSDYQAPYQSPGATPISAPAHEQGYYQAPQQHQQQQQQQYFAGQPQQQQQGQHMPQQQQVQQFQTVVPIANLSGSPAPVQCPSCGQRALTRVTFQAGNTTNVWALLLCLTLCLGCIPYLINGTKDVIHNCGNCGVQLATWHRSGRTDQHLHA